MDNPTITNIDNRTLAMGDNKYRNEILLSGEVVVKGELLGYVTASSKLAATAVGDSDGREYGTVFAAEDKDASGGDTSIKVLIQGDVDDSQITLDGAETLASFIASQPFTIRQILRNAGILVNTYDNVLIPDNQ